VRGSATRGRTLLSFALALAFVASISSDAGAYHSDRQRELQRLIQQKQQQIASLNGQEQTLLARLSESSARQALLESELRSAEARLAVARRELAKIERRLDVVSGQLTAATRELEQTIADLQEQQRRLDARVAEIYMGAPTAYESLYERAQSFTDVVDATAYVNSVVSADRAMLDELEHTKAEVEAKRAEIEQRKDALEADRKSAAETASRINDIRSERAAKHAAIAQEVVYQRAILAELQKQKSHYEHVLRSYERESQKIADFLRGQQSGQQAIQGRGGWLKWPVSGTITSGYGWRTHPIYNYRSFHTGIDIGAPSGATVKAARHGEVVYTGYNGAYGLVVIIDHGNAVATLYAHLSQTYVRTGENVSTLESVGAVGSTGWSTGPHLHFEVRVNGEHQNPMIWL